MKNNLKLFSDTAQGLAKNPLGIIALFIVLVYGFASLVTVLGTSLTSKEKLPLIYFLVFFPILVLGVFAWLVSCHSGKLYGPGDYRDEKNYIRMQLSAAASLAAATAKHTDANAEVMDFNQIAYAIRKISFGSRRNSISWRNRILWVDDRPENNVYERKAFEALGLSFSLALSTNEALEILKRSKFACIISDMGRREGPKEGYILLEAIRKQGERIPFIIYAGSNAPEHKQEASERGAQGSTNNPQELFEIVTKAVIKQINE